MKFITVIAGIIVFASTAAYSQATQGAPKVRSASADTTPTQIDRAKEADIRRLLDLVGATALANTSMDQMEQNIRPMMTNSLPPGEYREKLVDLFFEKFHSKRDTNQLVALIIPIYDKYYTHADIKTLIQFYESPTGRKMAASLPNITAESGAAGQKWGEQLGRDSMIEVLQEHPDLRQALESAKANPQQ